MRFYSEGFNFKLKIKLNIWDIFQSFMVFYSICSLSAIQICPILLMFKLTPVQMRTCKVKLSDAETETKTRREKTTNFKTKST